jgi:hypothetical protein
MGRAGASTFRIRSGGGGSWGATLRRPRAATAAAVAALTALAACETAPRRSAAEERAERAREVMQEIRAGLDLYEARDFALAAPRFHAASQGARDCRDVPMERRTTAAECAAWLLARSLPQLAECSARLEDVLRRERRSDPAASALVALGAIAGGRELPALRIPPDVQPLVRAAAER